MAHIFVCDKCGASAKDLKLEYFAFSGPRYQTVQAEVCEWCAEKLVELIEKWLEEDVSTERSR